jgi:hypothetical protein
MQLQGDTHSLEIIDAPPHISGFKESLVENVRFLNNKAPSCKLLEVEDQPALPRFGQNIHRH